jgi:hypothetical protein
MYFVLKGSVMRLVSKKDDNYQYEYLFVFRNYKENGGCIRICCHFERSREAIIKTSRLRSMRQFNGLVMPN